LNVRDSRRVFHPVRRPHFVRATVASVLLVVTALPVRRDHVSELERRVFDFFNSLPEFLYWPMWACMQAGNAVAVPIAAFVALMFRKVRLALDLLVAGAGAWILAKLVKQWVVRGRPGQLLADVTLRHAPAAGHGYVSGHAAVIAALATVATPYLDRTGRIVVWTLTALVCSARMYVGAHLPLDVAGGAALGWAVGSIVHLLLGTPDMGAEPGT
jgi:glycosyltransferase 2 family protein